MGAVTYPDADVANALAEHFVLYKINMMERHPDFKEACAGAKVMWGPTIIVADARGNEVRRWTGWLDPKAFVAELDLTRALALHHSAKFQEALEGFTALVEGDTSTSLMPEALYWQGISGFMAGKMDWDALGNAWRAVAKTYPGTRFGMHASVINQAPNAG